MRGSEEREQARQKLIELAAIYLDAAGLLEASLLERLPAGARLQIDLRVIPDASGHEADLSAHGANL